MPNLNYGLSNLTCSRHLKIIQTCMSKLCLVFMLVLQHQLKLDSYITLLEVKSFKVKYFTVCFNDSKVSSWIMLQVL